MKCKHNWKLVDAATRFEGYNWYFLLYHCSGCKALKGEYKEIESKADIEEQRLKMLENQQRRRNGSPMGIRG